MNLLKTKALALIFTFCMVLMLTACGNNTNPDNTTLQTTETLTPSSAPSQGTNTSTTNDGDIPDPAHLLPKIKDNINEIDDTILKGIAQNYLLIFGFDSHFAVGELLDYGRVFPYFVYGGVYRLNPFNPWEIPELHGYFDEKSTTFSLPIEVVDNLILEGKIDPSEISEYIAKDGAYSFESFFWDVRPELHHYFNKDTWMLTLPTKTVDDFILGKFNTVLNRSQIPEWVEYETDNDTYTFEAFTGSFLYEILIDAPIEIEGTLVRFICTATMYEEVQIPPLPSYRIAFTIELIDGEYKYISTELLNNEKK